MYIDTNFIFQDTSWIPNLRNMMIKRTYDQYIGFDIVSNNSNEIEPIFTRKVYYN